MGPLRAAALSLVALVSVAACGTVTVTPPAPTPADFTAIGFDAKGLDQPDPVRLRIYIFRDRDAFERLRTSVDMCARSYVTDPGSYETVEQSPYVLAAQGPWGPRFKAAVRESIDVAAGTGD